ncbi:MAG: glycosyltransferase [Nocardioidaceae bacterium]
MIGYYVHHQGLGHLHRLASVRAHLREPVTVLSSLPRPLDWSGPWVRLAADDTGVDDPGTADVTAGGRLHWVPRHHLGLAARSHQILDWVVTERPTLVVVDVSVEVSLLVRLAGVPVVVAAMPGNRSDHAHRTAYDLADTLLAPWPAAVPSSWPQRWLAKTVHCGSIGGFDGLPRPPRAESGRRGLLLWGSGGTGLDERRVGELRAAMPGWTWQAAVGSTRLGREELWRALCAADVVVTHGGQNAVAEVAAARAPAVVVADRRPFDEQVRTAAAVDGLGLAVGVAEWPSRDRWPELVRRAVLVGGEGWSRWSFGDGALRAARAIDGAARRLRPPEPAGLGVPVGGPVVAQVASEGAG